jgi:membrane protein
VEKNSGGSFSVWELLKCWSASFFTDKVPRLGAALAFYTTFSVAPLLVMCIALASMFFGTEAVHGHLKHEMDNFLGADGADAIQAMIAAAGQEHRTGIVSSVFGILALIIGATGVFVELKDSMNTIWGVQTRPNSGLSRILQDRAASFAMILSIAFLLLVSMILSTALSAIARWLLIPMASAHLADFIVSSIVITLLFAVIFKYLPDAEIDWSDVWIGSLITSLMFAIGKQLAGIYLGSTALASAYGAAGSLMVFLLWAYYSSQILFAGAEFTKVYAQLRGRHIPASSTAIPATADRRAEQIESIKETELTRSAG